MKFARPVAAAGLLLFLWGMSHVRVGPRMWVHPLGSAGPVRILRFDASVGALEPGGKAQLCYGVENARTVHISPWVSGVSPSPSRCLEIGPSRTTHYIIVAEGYDGTVAVRSLTIPVESPASEGMQMQHALFFRGKGARPPG